MWKQKYQQQIGTRKAVLLFTPVQCRPITHLHTRHPLFNVNKFINITHVRVYAFILCLLYSDYFTRKGVATVPCGQPIPYSLFLRVMQ